ncbi:MAG: helix-turn-helix domain-containing protein [Elusimicrobia bacterium]|nr:helix-turn-helix domain-containing protein [Elusimicrobiota bacterium]
MSKEIMDLKEVAKYLSFSQKKLYNLVKDRSIPFARIGGQYRFVKGEIDAWLTGPVRDNGKPYEAVGLNTLKSLPDTFAKRLLFVGLLTKELTKYNSRPIVVGGHAVEFYTRGNYTTADIDVVVVDYQKLGEILAGWGFVKKGRHWMSEEYDIVIESPANALHGSMEKIAEIEIKGLKVYLEGIEDIIIDRLNAFVHWKSKDDGEWARRMIKLNMDKIDWDYLAQKAKEEKVKEVLEKLKK